MTEPAPVTNQEGDTMSIARARHYPQPPPAADVLAAERCDHGAIIGQCALCRVAAELADDQDATTPAADRPPTPPVAGHDDQKATRAAEARPPATTPRPDRAPVVEHDDQDPRSTPWWNR